MSSGLFVCVVFFLKKKKRNFSPPLREALRLLLPTHSKIRPFLCDHSTQNTPQQPEPTFETTKMRSPNSVFLVNKNKIPLINSRPALAELCTAQTLFLRQPEILLCFESKQKSKQTISCEPLKKSIRCKVPSDERNVA
jgi:hypothetical protein